MAEWDIPLDNFFHDAEDAIETEVRTFISDFAKLLIDITPFRTGQLKGGYQAGINVDPPFSRPPDDKGGQVTHALIVAVADTWEFGDTFKIINYTEHGPYVNDGTVNQAGQFFVERAIAAFSS